MNEWSQQAVLPSSYGQLIVQAAAVDGVDPQSLLAASGLESRTLEQKDGRLSLAAAGRLLLEAIRLSGNPGLGFEIGLQSKLTSHGMMGYGLLSAENLQKAVELGQRFVKLRLPTMELRLQREAEIAFIEVKEALPIPSFVRPMVMEMFLSGLANMAPALLGRPVPAELMEFYFDHPQPGYFERYRHRLPQCRFGQAAVQLRFPARMLDRHFHAADPRTFRMVEDLCRQEWDELGLHEDLIAQVRRRLERVDGRLALEQMAESLNMSARTLKRRLVSAGWTYQKLREDVRQQKAKSLLQDSGLSIEAIASRLGYADPANFSRAFRRWTGRPPSAWR